MFKKVPFLLIFILLVSCESFNNKQSNNLKATITDSTLPINHKLDSLTGFYFLKVKMSFNQINELFKLYNIKSKVLSPKNDNTKIGLIDQLFEDRKELKKIEAYDFKINQLNLDTCYLLFYKDTLAYFNFKKSISAPTRIPSEAEKTRIYYENNFPTFEKLYSAFELKYGIPLEKEGELNIDKMYTIEDSLTNTQHKSFVANWTSNDGRVVVSFKNQYYVFNKSEIVRSLIFDIDFLGTQKSLILEKNFKNEQDIKDKIKNKNNQILREISKKI